MGRDPYFSAFAVDATVDEVLAFLQAQGYETELQKPMHYSWNFREVEGEEDRLYPVADGIVGISINTPYALEDDARDTLSPEFFDMVRKLVEDVPLQKAFGAQGGVGRMYHYFANRDLFVEYLRKLFAEVVTSAVKKDSNMVEGLKVDQRALKAYHDKITVFTDARILELCLEQDDVEIGENGEIIWDRTQNPRPGRSPIKAMIDNLPETPPDPEDPEDHRVDRPGFNDALEAYRKAYEKQRTEEID